MPTYEYRCGACGRHQDIVQKMSDPAMTVCPLCGAPQLERLISASAFALRGGGWYADGYGGKPGGETGGAAPKADAAKAEPAKAEPAKAEATPKAEPAPAPKPAGDA